MDPLLPTLVLCLLVLGALIAGGVKRANGGGHAWRPGCALTVEVLKQRLEAELAELATEGGRHRLTVVDSVEDGGRQSARWPQLTAASIAA